MGGERYWTFLFHYPKAVFICIPYGSERVGERARQIDRRRRTLREKEKTYRSISSCIPVRITWSHWRVGGGHGGDQYAKSTDVSRTRCDRFRIKITLSSSVFCCRYIFFKQLENGVRNQLCSYSDIIPSVSDSELAHGGERPVADRSRYHTGF